MFLRSKSTTENDAMESTKMETVDGPSIPTGRARRPLGDISNFAPSERAMNPDAKRHAPSHLAPPLPEPSVSESVASMLGSVSVTCPIDDSRAYMRRDADNIDSRDVENPLLCTEVVNEMYENFRRIEKEVQVDSNYMANQTHVNEQMRTILIDWLVSSLKILFSPSVCRRIKLIFY